MFCITVASHLKAFKPFLLRRRGEVLSWRARCQLCCWSCEEPHPAVTDTLHLVALGCSDAQQRWLSAKDALTSLCKPTLCSSISNSCHQHTTGLLSVTYSIHRILYQPNDAHSAIHHLHISKCSRSQDTMDFYVTELWKCQKI